MSRVKQQIRVLVKQHLLAEQGLSFSSDDFKDVYATARMAHMGQMRRDGKEYFSHPSEVRNIVRRFYPKDYISQMAALLHDSLEDAPGLTVDSVEEMEGFIRGSISNPDVGDEVLRVVRAVTHEKGGDYASYVQNLLGDEKALRVKLADMYHNLSSTPSPKQKLKYKNALDLMSKSTGGSTPQGISTDHWNTLNKLTESKKMKTRQDSRISLVDAYYPDLRPMYERNLMIESYFMEAGNVSGALLLEKKGVFKNLLVDAGQAALSTGAIAATGGAGGDVVVDVIFASKIAGEIIAEVTSMIQSAGEIGQIIFEAAKLDFDGSLGFEKQVKKLLEKTVKNQLVGQKAKDVIEKASQKINEILAKIARAVGKWVGALIPDDFGIGGPAFEALFSKALESAGKNSYKIAIAGIKALPMGSGKYLIDSGALEDMLKSISTAMLNYVNKTAELAGIDPDEDPKRWKQALTAFTAVATLPAEISAYPTKKAAELALKAAGQDEMAKLFAPFSAAKSFSKQLIPDVKKFLVKFKNDWIPTTVAVLRKLMSWLMAGLVLFQELIDPKKYLKMKKKMSPMEKEIDSWELGDMKLAAGYNRGNQMRISERNLRKIIRESLEEVENTCWDGYRPGAKTGKKTKKGKSGKRVPNCEKISEGTLYVQRGTYGMSVEDEDENYVGIGEMILDLLKSGDDDFFKAPQGVDPKSLATLNQKHEEGVQGGMQRWDPDVFEDYYNVDNERVLRLYARLTDSKIVDLDEDGLTAEQRQELDDDAASELEAMAYYS